MIMNENELMMEESRKFIIELQKALMVSVMDYQVKYGSHSVMWNININFIDELEMFQVQAKEH